MTPSLKAIVESILFASPKPLTSADLLEVIQKVNAVQFPVETHASAPSPSVEDLCGSSLKAVDAELVASYENNETQEVLSVQDQLSQFAQSQEGVLSRLDIQKVLQEIEFETQNNANLGFELVCVASAYQFRTKSEFAPYIRVMRQAPPSKLSQASLETLSMIAYRQPITRAEVDQLRGVDSGGVIKNLLERELIRIVGKKDEAGKPILYGTSDLFLEVFSLKSLKDLPTLKDLSQIEEEMREKSGDYANLVEKEESVEDSVFSETQDISSHFSNLELEEKDALDELSVQLKELDSLEEKMIQSAFPSSPSTENQSTAVIETSDSSSLKEEAQETSSSNSNSVEMTES